MRKPRASVFAKTAGGRFCRLGCFEEEAFDSDGAVPPSAGDAGESVAGAVVGAVA
jgi:hypothetical protein